MGSDRRCASTNAQGEPCGMAPLRGSQFCWAHDPGTRSAAAAARRRAGRSRARDRAGGGDVEWPEQVQLSTPAAVLEAVELVVRAETLLPNSSRRNRTIGYLLRVALAAVETGELADRLAALEQLLDRRAG